MTPGDIEDLLLAYEADVAVWTRTPDKYNYAEVVANRKKIADLLEARTPQEARETPVDWSFIRRVLEQGAAIQQDYAAGKYPTYEHYSARIDEAARERLATISAPVEPREIPTVRRWNAKYPGISMLEHNGDLVRSGFGPYVLAEDYDRLSRMLAAIEKARAIERKARQRLQTELLALCTQHVGGELDPDNANPAGNSHHE